MNIQEVKTVLRSLITTRTPITTMMWARHGIGKSAAVTQLGKELGMKVYSIILSQKEAVDVAGVLYTFEDRELGMSVTAAHPPEWFASAVAKGNVILFLDEFNMARKEVMNAAFELVLDRRLNNRRLPESVFIACAGNPDDERYDVTPMSESLRDRLMHIKVTPDVEAWLAWAKSEGSGIHPDVTRFIETDPKAAYIEDQKDDGFPVEIKHSFRSWERVGLIHNLPISFQLKVECMRGVVGPDLAVAFMQSFGTRDVPLDAAEILAFDDEARKRVLAYADPAHLRIDLLSASVENLVRYTKKNPKAATEKLNNVCEFIKMLPADVAQSCILLTFELPGWSDAFMANPDLKAKIDSIREALAVSEKAA